jgi:hypothetical protein
LRLLRLFRFLYFAVTAHLTFCHDGLPSRLLSLRDGAVG